MINEWIDDGMRFTNEQPATCIQTLPSEWRCEPFIDFNVCSLDWCLICWKRRREVINRIRHCLDGRLESICYAHDKSTPTSLGSISQRGTSGCETCNERTIKSVGWARVKCHHDDEAQNVSISGLRRDCQATRCPRWLLPITGCTK